MDTDVPYTITGLYVVAHARVDDSIPFIQRHTLNVSGEWVGRVPQLAICREFDREDFYVQHCDEAWEHLGLAGGYKSEADAKRAVARSYPGIESRWVQSTVPLEDAKEQWQVAAAADACSFCGRTPPEIVAMVGTRVRICSICIDDFHKAIHDDADET